MLSVNVYDLIKDPDIPHKNIENFNDVVREVINDYEEELKTMMEVEQIPFGKYRGFSIVTDKVYNQTVRVKGEVVRSVISSEIYRAYFKEENLGALVTLCKFDDAEKVKDILSEKFDMCFEQHTFDIMKIISEASDVRTAKFKVKIETVDSISMKGTRVNDTRYYERLFTQGNLNAVMVTFDTPSQSVTFRISKEGKILLYSQMNDNEILNLVEQLLDIG